jgi:hypothetical protein
VVLNAVSLSRYRDFNGGGGLIAHVDQMEVAARTVQRPADRRVRPARETRFLVVGMALTGSLRVVPLDRAVARLDARRLSPRDASGEDPMTPRSPEAREPQPMIYDERLRQIERRANAVTDEDLLFLLALVARLRTPSKAELETRVDETMSMLRNRAEDGVIHIQADPVEWFIRDALKRIWR